MNISISEIVLVCTVALVVIKPQQLPQVALSVGRFAKLLRHLFVQMKKEVNTLIEVPDKLESPSPTPKNLSEQPLLDDKKR